MRFFNKNSKVVCVVAVHKRFEVSVETIRLLNDQTHQIEVVVVGAKPERSLIAKNVDCHFLRFSNDKLGKKWQAGLSFARKLSPDAVMICGSDSWLTRNWVEKMLPNLNNADVVGKNIFYTCNAIYNRPLSIIKRTYANNNNLPAGSGRIISADILNKIDWKMFPPDRNKGLDTACYQTITAANGVYSVFNDDDEANILGIKSHWDVITSYSRLKTSKNLRELKFNEKCESWIERNYPGGVKIIKNLSIISHDRLQRNSE